MSARSRQERARKRARRARRREEAERIAGARDGSATTRWFGPTRPVKRIFRPDGSVTRVHENCGFVMEMTFAGGDWMEERK